MLSDNPHDSLASLFIIVANLCIIQLEIEEGIVYYELGIEKAIEEKGSRNEITIKWAEELERIYLFYGQDQKILDLREKIEKAPKDQGKK